MKDNGRKRLRLLMFTTVPAVLFASSAFVMLNVALSDQGTGVRNRTNGELPPSSDLNVSSADICVSDDSYIYLGNDSDASIQ